MFRTLRLNYPLVLLLITYGIILNSFPLRNQPGDPYLYAAAAEGYFNFASILEYFQPSGVMPDISGYHPYHPLSHMLAAYSYSMTGISALQFLVLLNNAGALLFAFFFYLTCLKLWKKHPIAVVLTSLVLFSHVFWGSAISAEVHIASLALLMAAAYFLITYLIADSPLRSGFLIWAAVCYIVSGAFHLAVAIYGFAGAAAFIGAPSALRKWKLNVSIAFLVLAGFSFFYGFLLFHKLQLKSLAEYFGTMSLYVHLPEPKFSIMDSFRVAADSFVYAIFYPGKYFHWWPGLILCLLLIFGFFRMLRYEKRFPVRNFLIAAPIIYLVTLIFFRARPDAVNSWLAIIPAIFLIIGYTLESISNSVASFIIGGFLVASFFGINFHGSIYPKTMLNQQEYIYFSDARDIPRNTQVAFYVTDGAVTAAEIWAAGSLYGLRQQKHFYACCQQNVAKGLLKLINARRPLLIVSDAAPNAIPEFLIKNRIKFTILRETTGIVAPEWILTSFIRHGVTDTPRRKNLQMTYIP